MEMTNKTNELSARTDSSEITCLSFHKDERIEERNTEPIPPVVDIKADDKSSDNKPSICDISDKTVIQKTQNGNDFDSGIDTSDSCDEKKYKKQSQAKVVRRQHSRSFNNTCNVRSGDFNSI